MAENPIDLVRSAEAEAEAEVREAQRKAGQIVDEAHADAAAKALSAEDAARKAAADKVAAAHAASQKTLEDAMGALAGEMNTLKEGARARQPQAVKMILEKLA